MKFLCLFAIFLSALANVNGLKALGILPFGSRSHFQIGYGILKSLIDAGESFNFALRTDKEYLSFFVLS